MASHSKDERERAEGDGSFREPTGWSTAGYGKRRLSREAGGGAVFDNLFRLGCGIMFGAFASIYVVLWTLPTERQIESAANRILFAAMMVTILGGALLARFVAKRQLPWMFTRGFLGAIVVVALVRLIFY